MLSSSDTTERELLPLSWLSQYGYCPRRCGLLALERIWSENEFTAAGRAGHERVHTARSERRGPLLSLFELPVFSRRLGLSGLCDCVEATESPGGVSLPFAPGLYTLYPVEYKHGVIRDEWEYHLQLCAQAICLEERYGCTIPAGAIFFIDAHRRDEVPLTPELRAETEAIAQAVADLAASDKLPSAQYGPKCKKCSLLNACQPTINQSADPYCRELFKLALAKEET